MAKYDDRYLYDETRESFIENASYEYFSDKKLTIDYIDYGIVLPPNPKINEYHCIIGAGGICTQKGEYVEKSGQRGGGILRDRVYGIYKFPEEVECIEEEVIYVNAFLRQWGHFLIDVVGRLWYVLKHDCSTIKFVYTVTAYDNKAISGNYLEFFTLLGIKEEQLIKIDKPTKFKRIILPESSIYPGDFYTKEWIQIFDAVVQKCISQKEEPKNKIYCSRRHFTAGGGGSEFGEEWMEKIFVNNGYSVVYFEELTLAEQIRTINSAKKMTMISGTLPHNLIFAKADIEVTVLYKGYFKYPLQMMVNHALNIKFIPVDIWYLPAPVTTNGPFAYKITKQFIDYAKEYGLSLEQIDFVESRFSIMDRIKYWIKYFKINKRLLLNGEIFSECAFSFAELKKISKKARDQN